MKSLALFFLLWLSATIATGQTPNIVADARPLSQLEKRLMDGDKTALYEIAPYFDSTAVVVEYLGYHRLEVQKSGIAKRIVDENCLFTTKEIDIWHASSKQFSDFLNEHKGGLAFSRQADAFLVTPLDDRSVHTEMRAITDFARQQLQDSAVKLLSPAWVRENKIDDLLAQRNPECLLLIASELFKVRDRHNRYHFYNDEFLNLLKYITGVDIGVENENNEISWHIDKDYDPTSRLNLLIYFTKYYKQYTWNERKSIFEKADQYVAVTVKEDDLFQRLSSKNDSIAMDAFTQLTVGDSLKVTTLANEYDRNRMDPNFAIPIFPFRFLKQLVRLTAYCRSENINFTGEQALRNSIGYLDNFLTFAERRAAEDRLIETLTLDNITAFEYWVIINEQSWNTTYSAGRILDIFYSKHFNELLANDKQLRLYLKKSALYDRLGIIGSCNNYLVKFTNLQEGGIEKLNALKTQDEDIILQIPKAVALCKSIPKPAHDTLKVKVSNKDYHMDKLRGTILSLVGKIKDKEQLEDSLTVILSRIRYEQIGEALSILQTISIDGHPWSNYSFMDRDFGFFLYDNFDTLTTRQVFLADYNKYDEIGFYKNMLDRASVLYKHTDGTLDYNKIFEILKYNVVTAFVGGGGSTQDNEVYAVIKVLELTHKTTLGYPKKLCNSEGVWACNSQDRANYWMEYLLGHGLVKRDKEAVSFHME